MTVRRSHGRALGGSILVGLLCTTTAVAQSEPAAPPTTTTPPPAEPGPRIELPGLESLTIGGEYRLRLQGRFDYDLRSSAPDDDDLAAQRVRLDFDAEVNDDLRVFVQLQDVRNWGEEVDTADPSADGLDLHQAFVDVGHVFGGEARVGRQILSYGDQRLIGARDWLNQGQSFDGARQRWIVDETGTIDVLVTNVRERIATPAAYDDAFFGGVYATFDAVDGRVVDLYALHLHDEETANGDNENRTTLGARWVEQFDAIEVGLEAATQVGDVDGADIPIGECYAATGRIEWRGDHDLAPFVRGEFNFASGDDPSTADNERFNDLFASLHAPLGIMDLALWENIRNFAVQVGIRPSTQDRLRVAWHTFDADDADVFRGPVTPPGFYPGDPTHSRQIGDEFDLVYQHSFDVEHATARLEVGYGVFLPGQGAEDANGSDDAAHFGYVQGTLRF